MLFNSLEFLGLLLITLGAYYAPGAGRWQLIVLLASSFAFYAWHMPALLALLLVSIGCNAFASWRVYHGRPEHRLTWAASGVAVNVAVLVAFKYGGLLAATAFGATDGSPAAWLVTLPLPIGISFYTFEGISLLVDTWRARSGARAGFVPEPAFGAHLRRSALFVSFFPHLVAGPILKAHDFMPQIGPKRLADVDWSIVFRALTVGYFLKVVVADNLARYTGHLAMPGIPGRSTIDLLGMLFGYSMQIFADFAGYSLIAIGLGALFGYRLPDNFRFPYISTSFQEFWTRWHISLSTWLREYLYFPLGGNRKGPVRTYLNLMIVMGVGGLWHGAAWSYAVWGLWHGVALAAERLVRDRFGEPKAGPLRSLARGSFVFGWVTLGWLLFKLPAFGDVVAYVRAVCSNVRMSPDVPMLVSIAALSLPVVAYHVLHLMRPTIGQVAWRRLEAGVYGGCLAMLVLNPGPKNAFIYFQF